MAYDERLAGLLRLGMMSEPDLREQKMFGGLCLMSRGHMVCGIHGTGAMFRVGRTHEAEALAIPGARPMTFTGRAMAGMVETGLDLVEDDDRRNRLMEMAKANARALPAKVAKRRKTG